MADLSSMRVCAVFAVLMLLISPQVKADTFVFVAAVSKYDADPDLKPLIKQVEVASEFVNVMLDSKIPKENIQFLPNPTRDAIKTNLKNFAKRVTENDFLIVLVSGHGVQDKEDGSPTFCVTNSRIKDSSSRLSEDDLLGFTTEQSLSNKSKFFPRAGTTLLIMDCCRLLVADSTGVHKETKSWGKTQIDTSRLKAGEVVFTACEEGGEGYCDLQTNRSYFMDALITGWGGLADTNGDNVIQLREYLDWVQSDVEKTVSLRENNRAQTPRWWPWNKKEFDSRKLDVPFLRKNVTDIYVGELPPEWKLVGSFKRAVFTDITFPPDGEGHEFRGTDFIRATFRRCTFNNCTFGPATELGRATFVDCTFKNCHFDNSSGLEQATFLGRCKASGTTWPGDVPEGVVSE